MSSFAAAMNALSFTWNGAVSQATPDPSREYSGRISLLFKSVRGLDKKRLFDYLSEAAQENLQDTIILCFHIRDCRGGKGERNLGRQCLEWLRNNYPEEYTNVFQLIPTYGRWDDLLATDKQGYNLIADQLKTDIQDMSQGNPISLCAKWAPTEGDSLDRNHKTVNTLCTILNISPKEYRKNYITPLRSYLKIVENFMCTGQWDQIEYEKVPSQAMRRLKNAFENHDADRFTEWKMGLEKGESEVKGKQVSPHELVREIRTAGLADEVCEGQWKVLEEEVAKLGSLSDSVFVVDTYSNTYSSNSLHLDVATSLGLLGCNAVEGPFHGHVITFHDKPSFQIIKDGTLTQRYQQLSRIPWGGSTNIQATFDLILERGKACNLTDKDMPKRLFIISDLQLNLIQYSTHDVKTNFEFIEQKYKSAGYIRPQVVFWNINGSSTDFPVTVDDQGTALISGFSPSIMKAVVNGNEITPATILRDTIDDNRYDDIRNALG
jgi:hypothetical protein